MGFSASHSNDPCSGKQFSIVLFVRILSEMMYAERFNLITLSMNQKQLTAGVFSCGTDFPKIICSKRVLIKENERLQFASNIMKWIRLVYSNKWIFCVTWLLSFRPFFNQLESILSQSNFSRNRLLRLKWIKMTVIVIYQTNIQIQSC